MLSPNNKLPIRPMTFGNEWVREQIRRAADGSPKF